jgi:hypothetical protein
MVNYMPIVGSENIQYRMETFTGAIFGSDSSTVPNRLNISSIMRFIKFNKLLNEKNSQFETNPNIPYIYLLTIKKLIKPVQQTIINALFNRYLE